MNFQIENMSGANKQIICEKSVWQSQEIWNGRQEFYNSFLSEENLVLFSLREKIVLSVFWKYLFKPRKFFYFIITFLANEQYFRLKQSTSFYKHGEQLFF